MRTLKYEVTFEVPDDFPAEELQQGMRDALHEFTGTVQRPVRPAVAWYLNRAQVLLDVTQWGE